MRTFEFVIVGAYALAFHGAPRASGDIDLFVRPTLVNARRVFDALARFGAPLESAGVTAADFAQPGAVYQIGLPPRRIDVLTEISGVTFDEAWASRVTGEVEGRRVGVIGRVALGTGTTRASTSNEPTSVPGLAKAKIGPERLSEDAPPPRLPSAMLGGKIGAPSGLIGSGGKVNAGTIEPSWRVTSPAKRGARA